MQHRLSLSSGLDRRRPGGVLDMLAVAAAKEGLVDTATTNKRSVLPFLSAVVKGRDVQHSYVRAPTIVRLGQHSTTPHKGFRFLFLAAHPEKIVMMLHEFVSEIGVRSNVSSAAGSTRPAGRASLTSPMSLQRHGAHLQGIIADESDARPWLVREEDNAWSLLLTEGSEGVQRCSVFNQDTTTREVLSEIYREDSYPMLRRYERACRLQRVSRAYKMRVVMCHFRQYLDVCVAYGGECLSEFMEGMRQLEDEDRAFKTERAQTMRIQRIGRRYLCAKFLHVPFVVDATTLQLHEFVTRTWWEVRADAAALSFGAQQRMARAESRERHMRRGLEVVEASDAFTLLCTLVVLQEDAVRGDIELAALSSVVFLAEALHRCLIQSLEDASRRPQLVQAEWALRVVGTHHSREWELQHILRSTMRDRALLWQGERLMRRHAIVRLQIVDDERQHWDKIVLLGRALPRVTNKRPAKGIKSPSSTKSAQAHHAGFAGGRDGAGGGDDEDDQHRAEVMAERAARRATRAAALEEHRRAAQARNVVGPRVDGTKRSWFGVSDEVPMVLTRRLHPTAGCDASGSDTATTNIMSPTRRLDDLGLEATSHLPQNLHYASPRFLDIYTGSPSKSILRASGNNNNNNSHHLNSHKHKSTRTHMYDGAVSVVALEMRRSRSTRPPLARERRGLPPPSSLTPNRNGHTPFRALPDDDNDGMCHIFDDDMGSRCGSEDDDGAGPAAPHRTDTAAFLPNVVNVVSGPRAGTPNSAAMAPTRLPPIK
eukprot:PhM_4_TR2964/c0_g1_i1/m.58701